MNKNNNLNDAEKHVIEFYVDSQKKSKTAEDMIWEDITKLSGNQIIENISYFDEYALLTSLNYLDINKKPSSFENYMKQRYKTNQERFAKYSELLDKRPEILPLCEVEFIKQNLKRLVEKGFFNKDFKDLRLYFADQRKENHDGMANKIIRDLKNVDERDDLLFDLMLACFNSSVDKTKKQARGCQKTMFIKRYWKESIIMNLNLCFKHVKIIWTLQMSL